MGNSKRREILGKKFINIAGVLEIHFTQDVTDNVAIYPSKDIARRALIATLNHIPEAIEGGMLEIPAKIIEKRLTKIRKYAIIDI